MDTIPLTWSLFIVMTVHFHCTKWKLSQGCIIFANLLLGVFLHKDLSCKIFWDDSWGRGFSDDLNLALLHQKYYHRCYLFIIQNYPHAIRGQISHDAIETSRLGKMLSAILAQINMFQFLSFSGIFKVNSSVSLKYDDIVDTLTVHKIVPENVIIVYSTRSKIKVPRCI